VILWRVRVTIVEMERQHCGMWVQLSYKSLSTVKRYWVL
jgi:hypothetical protein